jgi:hypothetical protein
MKLLIITTEFSSKFPLLAVVFYLLVEVLLGLCVILKVVEGLIVGTPYNYEEKLEFIIIINIIIII